MGTKGAARGELGGDGGNIGGDGDELGVAGGDWNIIERIIALIIQNDKISVQEITDSTGLSKRNCERIIAELKKDGIMSRIGSARTGRWVVNNR